MTDRMRGIGRKLVACLSTLTLALPVNAIPALAAKEEARTTMKHAQLKYVVPGKRIILEAEISDPNGIKLARCYFKAVEEANYVFVPMKAAAGGKYTALLPALGSKASSLNYLFLSVNKKNQVVKTQEFEVSVDSGKKEETPKWQTRKDGKTIKVNIEADKAPKTVAGFSDSIHCNAVESALRFGAVVGIGAAIIGGTAGSGGSAGTAGAAGAASSTGSVSGGTVTATGAGMSKAAIWTTAAVVAGAATVGGVAAASGGGGGGGGGDSSGGGMSSLKSTDIIGTWHQNYTMNIFNTSTCAIDNNATVTFDSTMNYLAGGSYTHSYTATIQPGGYTYSGSSSGTWTVSEFQDGYVASYENTTCGTFTSNAQLVSSTPLSVSWTISVGGVQIGSGIMSKQ